MEKILETLDNYQIIGKKNMGNLNKKENKMITKIYGSIKNAGDGSVYITWMESEELAQLDQDFEDEGWAEPCIEELRIESEGPVKILNTIETVQNKIKELEEELKEDYIQADVKWKARMEKKLNALMRIKKSK